MSILIAYVSVFINILCAMGNFRLRDALGMCARECKYDCVASLCSLCHRVETGLNSHYPLSTYFSFSLAEYKKLSQYIGFKSYWTRKSRKKCYNKCHSQTHWITSLLLLYTHVWLPFGHEIRNEPNEKTEEMNVKIVITSYRRFFIAMHASVTKCKPRN